MDRCLDTLEALGVALDQLPPEAPTREIASWLQDMARWLAAQSPQAVARFIAEALAFPRPP